MDFTGDLKKLYEIKNYKNQKTLQFSFVSKLYNTLDETIPIYDSEVAYLLNLKRPYHKDLDKRINTFLSQLDTIASSYKHIRENDLIPHTIKTFNEKFKDYDLPKQKILDFIFWSSGKAQRTLKS